MRTPERPPIATGIVVPHPFRFPSMSSSLSRRVLMSGTSVEAAIARLSDGIVQRYAEGSRVVLIGIQTGGIHLARQLAGHLGRAWRSEVPIGQLDIAMHRDDLDQRLAPNVHPTSIPFDISGKHVILVDDVLCSGRTSRAALDALNDLGRPQRVELAVLIDRPHRELPIQADFVGERVATRPGDRVDVQLAEGNGASQVLIESPPPPPPPAP
jgi:pyrimidine operon attenuation protein/uracil phosphoribosyltransferase